MDKNLLDILRCPGTGQALKMLAAKKLKILNKAITDGKITYADGSTVSQPLDAALITDNGSTIYRINDDIPVMLEDQSIAAQQVEGL
ncbi:MAG TPA: Trm112 family protein [Gammaproteobacteria bacterium]|nr:Trm112 family protein [Gammaproteobacteria bacterium]